LTNVVIIRNLQTQLIEESELNGELLNPD